MAKMCAKLSKLGHELGGKSAAASLFAKSRAFRLVRRAWNLLIRQGEIYVGADSDFNTFAPSFAGDDNGALRGVGYLREKVKAMKDK